MTSATDPWGVSSGPPIRETLRKRAMKRDIELLGEAGGGNLTWVVYGNSSLGDTYGEYRVTGQGDNIRDYSCDCQTHDGGQYRRQCSHIVRAIIWWEENSDEVEWAEQEKYAQGGEVARTEGVAATVGEVLVDITSAASPSPGQTWTEIPFNDVVDTTGKFDDVDDREGGEESERENEPYVDAGSEDGPDYEEDEKVYNPITSRVDRILSAMEDNGGELTPSLINSLTPTQPRLPTKFTTLRPQQVDAILECIEAFEDGVKVVFLSAPTGTGKTLIGEIVGRFFGHRAYTCTTKSLQEQILRDFDYAKVLKGRANYPTRDNPEVTCDSCTKNYSEAACWTCGGSGKRHCAFCHPTESCPYAMAKLSAQYSFLAVLNTAYLIREFRSPRSAFRKRPLFILDEADALEEQLMGFIELEVGPRLRQKLGIGLPDLKGKEESWVAWIEDIVLPAARLHFANISSTLFSMQADPKTMKEVERTKQLIEKLEWLLEPVEVDGEEVSNLAHGWVMDVRDQGGRWRKGGGDENASATVVFKPIKVDRFAHEVLWSNGPRFLLMSATLISPAQMAEDLGLERDEWTVVEVESSFPVERRPIVVKSIASVVKKNEEQALPLLVEAVDEIMDHHPDDRILVHTVSYPLTNYLYNRLDDRRRLHTYNHAGERERSLGRFLADDRGVMLAPSFERGIDLHGDDCRVIVIAKVPYPYLGDAQINARLYRTGVSGRRWYAATAIRDICQMTGRGMRSEDDWCISYILDAQFNKLYRENRAMFPRWWGDAVVWDANDPKWRNALADIYAGVL